MSLAVSRNSKLKIHELGHLGKQPVTGRVKGKDLPPGKSEQPQTAVGLGGGVGGAVDTLICPGLPSRSAAPKECSPGL